MDLIIVGIGGALGSLTRYQLGRFISQRSGSSFPIGTFLINISGAILLGFLTGLDTPENIGLLFGDGFLGAYTTFSTFMYEGFRLFQGNRTRNALIYIAGSLIIGVLGFVLGFALPTG